MPNELKPCPYCNGEYVNSPDGHYVHPFNDCDDRGRILQAGDIVWFNHRPIEDALQARIEERLKPILCAKCSDHIVAGEQGAICEVCASTQESAITELQTENAELKSYLCLGEKLDFLLEAYGLSDEPMTDKALEIKAWMQKHVIEPKAEVDRLRKTAIVWHKYPDEKPDKQSWYLTSRKGDIRMHFWLGSRLGFDTNPTDIPYVCPVQPHYWAYLPSPQKEEE